MKKFINLIICLCLFFICGCTNNKIDLSNIKFEDKEVFFDGNEHSILIEGELSKDIVVEYTGNNQINVGTYTIFAKLTNPKGSVEILSAELTIKKGDLTTLKFEDKEYIYDGKEHSIEIAQNLPKGVEVTYTNNNQVNPGIYEITAKLTDTTGSYEVVSELKATLTIYERKVTSIEDFEYTIEDDYINLTNFIGEKKDVFIPSKFQIEDKMYNVKVSASFFEIGKEINNFYFYGTLEDLCNLELKNNSSSPMMIAKNFYIYDENGIVEYEGIKYNKLTEAIIPEGVTTIKQYTFFRYKDLTKVVFPESLLTIKDGAFQQCDNIEDIQFSNNLKIIGKDAFANCISLNNVLLNEGLKTLEFGAFAGCDALSNIVLPNTLTVIEEEVFLGCENLTTLIIPESVTKIGAFAFFNSGLTTITIPKSIDTIEKYTFYNCTSLKTINLSNSIVYLGEYAFYNCNSLKIIDLPQYITTININTFGNCYNLESINIPKGVTSIGEYAFSYCYKLKTILIPNTVTSIGSRAFYECEKLESIIIPKSVTFIGSSVFYKCNNLTIYCEIKEKPNDWSKDWNNAELPVVWGYNSSKK